MDNLTDLPDTEYFEPDYEEIENDPVYQSYISNGLNKLDIDAWAMAELFGALEYYRPFLPEKKVIGRPQNSGKFRNAQQFTNAIDRELSWNRGFNPVTKESICDMMVISPQTFRRYLRKFGLSWKEIKKRYQ